MPQRPRPFLRLASLATSVLTLSMPVGALAQQPAQPPAEPPRLGQSDRFSEGFELRTGTDDAPRSDDGAVAQPLDPAARERSQDIRQDLRQPDLGTGRPAPDPARPVDAAAALDLFAGPERPGPTVSRRENLPQTTQAARPEQPAARALDTSLDPDEVRPERGAVLAPADLFKPIGPVRGPTRDEALGRRGPASLDDLRRSLPVSADDPFAPVGTRVGRFILYPFAEQSLGASDNLTNSIDGRKGAFGETTLGGRLVSDWTRHLAEINALATYRRNGAGPVKEEPRVDLDGKLRLDLDRDWTATLRGAFSFSRDDALSGGLPLPASAQDDVLAFSASGELARAIGRANVALTLAAVREDRADGAFSTSGFLPGESYTTYSAGLRAGYELAPRLKPFVAASIGRRLFDDETALGLARDSVIPAIRGGLGFDFGEKLSGEVALGYAWNVPDEDAFETDANPTIDATINWSPRRGTDVLLRAETYFEPDAAGASTSTLYQGSLGIRHRATARVDLEGRLIAALRDGPTLGDEHLYAAETGLTYWLNRQLALLARYRYDRFDGPVANGDYDANTFRIGMRIQR